MNVNEKDEDGDEEEEEEEKNETFSSLHRSSLFSKYVCTKEGKCQLCVCVHDFECLLASIKCAARGWSQC